MFRRPRRHDDFSDEIQAHLDLETDRLIADGMEPDDARAAARRMFGNVARTKERFYEASRWIWLEQVRQDVRYAVRSMRRAPAFVATTVLTLAVGIGLLTAAFTIVNAYVLRPFAIRDPQTLQQIGWQTKSDGGQSFRWRDYDELARRTDLFSATIGEHTRMASSADRPLTTAVVSRNYFDALGPAMTLGRAFGAVDANAAGRPVVIGDQAWTRLFARDPAVLGRALEINGRMYSVIGVVGPLFTGLGDQPRDVFVPVSAWPEAMRPERQAARQTEVFVRLRPGVTVPQAETAIGPFLKTAVETREGLTARVQPHASPNPLSLQMIAILSPVFAAFLLVLATACANVSNVMLVRAVARHREIAVRLSIGASRGRVIRQLLTEGLVLAVTSGAAGLMLAAVGLRLATRLLLSTLPPSVLAIMRIAPLTLDARVFLFVLAVSAAATLLFALVPARQASRVSLTGALHGQGGDARRGSRLRSGLVVVQVGVAIVLVILAVTIARNGARVGALDVGFEARGVLSINVRGADTGPVRPLAHALEADPRVASIAVTSGNPLFNAMQHVVAAAPERAGAPVWQTPLNFVSPEYFDLLRIPIARGRGFRADEASGAAHVAIVSAATASALWPGEDPIGKTIRIERAQGRGVDELPEYPIVTVVGTVRDVVSGLVIDGPDRGHMYLPIAPENRHAAALLVRSRSGTALSGDALQDTFRRTVRDPQTLEAVPLEDIRDLEIYPLRAASWVASLLGAVALLLSVSGVYGVLTYALSQRTREIGIRMALGATPAAVMALVLGQSGRLAGVGMMAGALVAFAGLKILDSAMRLSTLSLLDAGAFASAIAAVVAATALAAWHPARRVTRIDPATTLRADA
jgi:predicted permease